MAEVDAVVDDGDDHARVSGRDGAGPGGHRCRRPRAPRSRTRPGTAAGRCCQAPELAEVRVVGRVEVAEGAVVDADPQDGGIGPERGIGRLHVGRLDQREPRSGPVGEPSDATRSMSPRGAWRRSCRRGSGSTSSVAPPVVPGSLTRSSQAGRSARRRASVPGFGSAAKAGVMRVAISPSAPMHAMRRWGPGARDMEPHAVAGRARGRPSRRRSPWYGLCRNGRDNLDVTGHRHRSAHGLRNHPPAPDPHRQRRAHAPADPRPPRWRSHRRRAPGRRRPGARRVPRRTTGRRSACRSSSAPCGSGCWRSRTRA